MRGIFSVSERNGLGKISEGYTQLFFISQQFYHLDRFRPLSLEALCLHLPHVLLYRPTSLPGWKGLDPIELSTDYQLNQDLIGAATVKAAQLPILPRISLALFPASLVDREAEDLKAYKVNLIRSLVNLHTAFASMLNIVAAHVYLSVVSESSQI